MSDLYGTFFDGIVFDDDFFDGLVFMPTTQDRIDTLKSELAALEEQLKKENAKPSYADEKHTIKEWGKIAENNRKKITVSHYANGSSRIVISNSGIIEWPECKLVGCIYAYRFEQPDWRMVEEK